MSKVNRVKVEANATGQGKISVDGVDISDSVRSVNVGISSGEITEVIIGLRPDVVQLDVDGIVATVRDISSLLDSIDPKSVDQEALDRQGWDNKTVTATVIEILKEML